MQSPSLSCRWLCSPSYRCTSCAQFISAHKHTKRPVGWGWKRAGSVCLSLVFQQEAPGPARHLRGAADKEEAINPQKITRTDTLSHRNTTTQPDSFRLQRRQRKKDGGKGVSSPCEQQDTQKASSPLWLWWFEFPPWWSRGWAECARVGLHLIWRCFEFRIGQPTPNQCATDGHCFRDLRLSKEQLAVVYSMLSLFKSNILSRSVCVNCACVQLD